MEQRENELDVEIIIPSSSDALDIVNLYTDVWLATYPNAELGITREDILEFYNQENVEKRKTYSENYLANIPENEYVFSLKIQGKIVGVISLKQNNRAIEILTFYILPIYQSKGYGTKMFNEVIKNINLNYEEIFLKVASYNHLAIEFYKKLGFVISDEKIESNFKMPISQVVIPETKMVLKKKS